jgi:hypothetical protein
MEQRNMKVSKSRLLIIMVICSLIFQGCIRFKLVGPPQEEKVKPASHKYAYTLKSRYIYAGGPRRGDRSEDMALLSVVGKALHDSFAYHGISDVIKSEKLETDRINIVAYIGGEPDLAGDSILLNVLYIPWSLVTLATLGLVPMYGVTNIPVEIHILDPAREHDRQLRIIHTNYDVAQWWWFPFAFMSNDNTPTDIYYHGYGIGKVEKIDYLGWRRVFDRVLVELERND